MATVVAKINFYSDLNEGIYLLKDHQPKVRFKC